MDDEVGRVCSKVQPKHNFIHLQIANKCALNSSKAIVYLQSDSTFCLCSGDQVNPKTSSNSAPLPCGRVSGHHVQPNRRRCFGWSRIDARMYLLPRILLTRWTEILIRISSGVSQRTLLVPPSSLLATKEERKWTFCTFGVSFNHRVCCDYRPLFV